MCRPTIIGGTRPSTGARLMTGLLAGLLAVSLSACSGLGEPPGEGGGRWNRPSTASSGPLALSVDGRTLWVVNPDADSLTAVDVSDPAKPLASRPIEVGAEPWSLAVAPDDTIVVMNRRSGSLSFVSASGDDDSSKPLVTETYVGAEPGGLLLSATGKHVYVTLSADAAVAVVDVATRDVIGHVAVGPMPWALARRGETLIVAHRLARPVDDRPTTANDGREGWLTFIDISGQNDDSFALETAGAVGAPIIEVPLANNGFGFPNGLESLAVVGDVVYAAHLLNSPEPPNDFQTTVSGGLSAVSLATTADNSRAIAERSLDHNDPAFSTPVNFPRAVAASPDGETLYLALAGSDSVMGIDISEPNSPILLGFWPSGRNPRGVVVAEDGETAYVMNYLSRDLSVLDLGDVSQRRELARVSVTPETLPADIARGKILFNNANDPRLSLNGWVSCASCHLDGGGDGTTWPREEGARQTMPLWSLAGTAPFHAAGTRDELQDFEIDIERFMRGVGLAPGAAPELLGGPSAGTSADIDALATFLTDGFRTPAAPATEATAAERGRAVFAASGCQGCHAGPAWTTSSLPGPPGTLAPGGEQVVTGAVHDVGTFDPTHDITGAEGFNVPTLLGLAYTAPYFHDGSAATLNAVLAHVGHSGAPLDSAAEDDLIAFLHSLDGNSETFALP